MCLHFLSCLLSKCSSHGHFVCPGVGQLCCVTVWSCYAAWLLRDGQKWPYKHCFDSHYETRKSCMGSRVFLQPMGFQKASSVRYWRFQTKRSAESLYLSCLGEWQTKTVAIKLEAKMMKKRCQKAKHRHPVDILNDPHGQHWNVTNLDTERYNPLSQKRFNGLLNAGG